MRKILTMIAACMLAATGYAQTAKILRHHQGQVTQYNAGQISSAMSESVDGDTLYLSDGVFAGFTVSKAITVIGTGQQTRITGDVSINIPNSPTLTARLLDALNISGTVNVSGVCTGLNIRKCAIADLEFSANASEVIIDRCNITDYFYLSSYVQGLTATNCYIKYLLGSAATPDYASFVNCNVAYVYNTSSSSPFKGNLINCILSETYRYSDYSLSSAVYMVNTLYNTSIAVSNAVVRDCYGVSNISNYTGSDTSALISAGYLGNDGKAVGMYGGNTPYTLTPSTPTVTSSKISVDTENKKLNVSITVKANN